MDTSRVFPDRKSLIDFVKSSEEANGFFVSIGKSRQGKVWLKCDLGGTYRETGGQRHSASRLTNCPFQVVARFFKKDNIWRIILVSGEHNHGHATIATGHSIARRLNPEEKKRVREMSENGVRVAEILNSLKSEFGNTISTAKEVHNELSIARREELCGRSPVMALYESLERESFEFSAHFNEDGSLERLIFSHKDSVKLCQRWMTVFVMDCTYKTNKFGMPLLNIVGITATYHSFNAGFAFLREETEHNYAWALQQFKEITQISPKVVVTDRELALMNALSAVLPACKNLLCIWHINKNIVSKCKPLVSSESWDSFLSEWNSCVYSPSEEDFQENWQCFLSKYSREQQALSYISQTWLPWKERFVSCYTGKQPHFGTTSSSRGEGSHFVLKRYLKISQLDIFSVYKRLKLMLANQFVELSKHLEDEKIKVYHRYSDPIFSNIIHHISKFALDKIWNQFQLLSTTDAATGECLGTFTQTYGLPCKHLLKQLIEIEAPIALDSIHRQWHLTMEQPLLNKETTEEPVVSPRTNTTNRIQTFIGSLTNAQIPTFLSLWDTIIENPIQQVSNPQVVTKKRGRPSGSLNKVSKRREKSAFEFIEGRKCRSCGKGGHNSATCGK